MVTSIEQLHLDDSIGSHDPREVIVLADTGYDNKQIETAIVNKHWHVLMALKKTRSVKSEALSLATPKARQWCSVFTFFRHHRR